MVDNRFSTYKGKVIALSSGMQEVTYYTYEDVKNIYDVVLFNNGHVVYIKNMQVCSPEKAHEKILIKYHIINPAIYAL